VLDREQPVLLMMSGVPERRTHSYVRHGTTSLFAALDVASGVVIGQETPCSRVPGLAQADRRAGAARSRRPHHHGQLRDPQNRAGAVMARPPTALPCALHADLASWINQVERWFAELTRKQLRRGVHTSAGQLERDIRAFIEQHDENPKPYRWTKSADEILASVRRFCQTGERTLCGEL
jgi:hypothetical protein